MRSGALAGLIVAGLWPGVTLARAALDSPASPGAVTVTAPPGCAPTDGAYDPGGTLSWVPTCAGEWFVPPISPLPTMSVVGVPSMPKAVPFAPDMSKVGTTQALIQGIARKEDGPETGLHLNYDVAHGGSHVGGNDQKVGLADFVRAHPGPNGSRPGDTWAFNPDIQVAAGSGNLLAVNTEADFNNFNDCTGHGCFMVMLWHNYLSSHPITADTYISGESNKNSGTAIVEGTKLTSTGGAPFTSDTTTVAVDGKLVRVAGVVGPRALTLVEDLGRRPQASYVWRSHLVHTGIMISDDNAVADQDFLSSSSGYYAFYLNGHHNVLFSAASDAAPYAMVARAGQAVCFDGLDGCLLHVAGDRLQYQAKGHPVVQIVGVAAPANADFMVIRNAAAGPGSGPGISVEGASPSAPLKLSGKGGAPVEIVGSPFKLPVYTIAALPPCRVAEQGEEAFVADEAARTMPTWHGPVLGGGTSVTRSIVACNGANWQYE